MTPTDPITASLNRLLKNLGSDKSRRAYEDDWTRYRAWLTTQNIEVVAAKPSTIEDHIIWLQERGNTRSTCGRALSIIRSVYGILVRDEVTETNPAREVKNPKFDSTPNTPWLEEHQMQKLLDLPADTWREKRDRLCVCLLFGLGWRRAEVARMKAEDFQHGSVTGIVKGNREATVGVPKWLLGEIEAWKEYAGIKSGPLLPRSEDNSREISGDIVYKIVKASEARAGLSKGSATPHGLRRTSLTLSHLEGVPLDQLQNQVSHKSQSTTERYIKTIRAAKNAPSSWMDRMVNPKANKSANDT